MDPNTKFILEKAGPPLAIKIVEAIIKTAWNALRPPAIRAIDTVATEISLNHNGDGKSVKNSLKKWCKSQSFNDVLRSTILTGDMNINVALQSFFSVVDSGETIGGCSVSDLIMPRFLFHFHSELTNQDAMFKARRDEAFRGVSIQTAATLIAPTNLAITDTQISWFDKISAVSKEIDFGRVHQANLDLLKIRTEMPWDHASMETRALLCHLRGLCLLQLEQNEEASTLLKESLSFDAENALTMAYLAQAQLQLRHFKQALHWSNEALSRDPDNGVVLATRILCLFKGARYSDLVTVLKTTTKWETSRFCLLAIGHTFIEQNDFSSAIAVYESALQLSPGDLSIELAIATARTQEILYFSLNQNVTFSDAVPQRTQLLLSEAANKLHDVFEASRASDNPMVVARYLQLQMSLLSVQGMDAEALECCEKLLSIVDTPTIRVKKVQLLITLRKFEAAEADLEQIESMLPPAQLEDCRLGLHLQKEEYAEALILLKARLAKENGLAMRMTISGGILRTLRQLGLQQELENFRASILSEGTECSRKVIVAIDFMNHEEFEQALKVLPVSDETLSEEDRITVVRLASRCLIETNKDLTAADLLKYTFDETFDLGILDDLISIQVTRGWLPAARKNAKQMRILLGHGIPAITDEIEAKISEILLQWDDAIDAMQSMVEAEPTNSVYKLKLIEFALKGQQRQLATKLIDEIKHVDLTEAERQSLREFQDQLTND